MTDSGWSDVSPMLFTQPPLLHESARWKAANQRAQKWRLCNSERPFVSTVQVGPTSLRDVEGLLSRLVLADLLTRCRASHRS